MVPVICNQSDLWVYSSRSHSNTKVCSQVWLFLDTMLECQHHNSRQQTHLNLQESHAPISVHLVQVWTVYRYYWNVWLFVHAVLQAMCDVMGSRDARECVKPVLSCLEHILKSHPLPSVLYKFEVVVSTATTQNKRSERWFLSLGFSIALCAGNSWL